MTFIDKSWLNAADRYTFPTFRGFGTTPTNLTIHYLDKDILTSQ